MNYQSCHYSCLYMYNQLFDWSQLKCSIISTEYVVKFSLQCFALKRETDETLAKNGKV